MAWMSSRENVFKNKIDRQNDILQNKISIHSVAALTLTSLFGHFASNLVQGNKLLIPRLKVNTKSTNHHPQPTIFLSGMKHMGKIIMFYLGVMALILTRIKDNINFFLKFICFLSTLFYINV